MKLYFVVFLAIAISVYVLLHYFVFRNIAIGLNLHRSHRQFLKILFFIGAISFPLGEFLSRKISFSAYPIVFFGSLWLGIITMAFAIFLLVNILTVFFRSEHFKYYSTIGSLIVLCLMFLYSYCNVSRGPSIREIRIPIKKYLPANFTIVQLSDLHLGVLTKPEWLENIVKKTNNFNPDLIVITGDLINGDTHEYDSFIEILKQLKSKYGTVIITGNHEFYAGVPLFLDIARKTGMTVLRNENVTIGNLISIAGVDDKQGKQFGEEGGDLKSALKDCDKNKPVILLNHRPENFKEAVELGADLQLSGHTHVGQIPPMDLITMLSYKYPYGLYSYKDSFIYSSSGTGTWGPPLRLFSRSEIVRFTIEKQ